MSTVAMIRRSDDASPGTAVQLREDLLRPQGDVRSSLEMKFAVYMIQLTLTGSEDVSRRWK